VYRCTYQQLPVVHELPDIKVRASDVVHTKRGRQPFIEMSDTIYSGSWTRGLHLSPEKRYGFGQKIGLPSHRGDLRNHTEHHVR
jgi:hypothetical protein